MKRGFLVVPAFGIALAVSGQQSVQANQQAERVVTVSGYNTEILRYSPDKVTKSTTIVYLHGKNATPQSNHNARFISSMVDLGYEVVAPLMPWTPATNYSGSLQDGYTAIDEAIARARTDRIVLVGHSMGGITMFQYGAGKVSEKVVGLISIAPGHDPNINEPLRTHTEGDAKKACEMMSAGRGDERSRYAEMNSGRTYFIEASAKYFCTYYDVTHFPNTMMMSEKIKTPFFLLSGAGDKLTKHYRHAELFAAIPHSDKNKHAVLSGDHGGVLYQHNDDISAWIESLGK